MEINREALNSKPKYRSEILGITRVLKEIRVKKVGLLSEGRYK